MSIFCEKIKDLRKELDLTQEGFATMLNLPRYMVANWEQGRSEPSLSDIIKISEVFNVSTDYILDRVDDFGAVNVNVAGDNLSSEEKELIKSYRKLDFDQQRTVRIQIGALVESNV